MADVITKTLLLLAVVLPGTFSSNLCKNAPFSILFVFRETGGRWPGHHHCWGWELPGMPNTDGFTITDTLQKRATDLGAEIVILSISIGSETNLCDGDFWGTYLTQRLSFVSGGASPRHAETPTEENLPAGCFLLPATECSIAASRCFGIGGGNTAVESQFLARFCWQSNSYRPQDHLRANILQLKRLRRILKTEIRIWPALPQLMVTIYYFHPSAITRQEKSAQRPLMRQLWCVFVLVGRVPSAELPDRPCRSWPSRAMSRWRAYGY